jgi:aminoglycoside/choline kinase family phosphotransferase
MSHDAPTPAIPSSVPVWTDAQRQADFDTWLSQLAGPFNLKTDSLRKASEDASFRRYFRIDSSGASYVIMDAPPAQEDCRPFVKVAELMHAAQVNAPQVLAWDQARGFMLLTDMGQQTMLQGSNRNDPRANLACYLEAIEALVAWQCASKPGVLPPYDEALLRLEMQLFPDWYLARHRGVAVEGELQRTLETMFALIVQNNLAWPQVYVHRDFMPRNLMLGSTGLGVLDFQDAVYGPITYDIACLMRDAFLSWEEDFCLDVTVRYWERARKAGLPVGTDFGEFYRGVEWMGLQRHLKVAGIFARLTLRDGKPQYLADTPRFISYMRATCARYRELKPLLRLIEKVEGIEVQDGYAFGRL